MLHRLIGMLMLLLAALGPVKAAERAIIILDGSGSMWAQIGGEARISIARQTLDEVLAGVPGDLELGFMSYGHREKGSCEDIELLVPAGPGTAAAIEKAAAAINPKGKTPISAAVKLAAEDLRYTEDKATVILITDGIETCEADPCALASELEAAGVDFTTHVVGFGLSDEEGAQVACLAENTGGQYLKASNGKALAAALTQTVTKVAEAQPAPAPEPSAVEYNLDPEVVLGEAGEELDPQTFVTWNVYKAKADGSEGAHVTTDYYPTWRTNLEPGDYLLNARLDYVSVTQPITIEAGKVTKPYIVLNAGRLILRPLVSEGAEVDSNAAVFTAFNNGESTTSYGETKLYVPAGDTEVKVTIGSAVLEETVAVGADTTVVRDLVVGAGRATVEAYYVEGMKIEDGNLFVEVLSAKQAIDGSRKSFAYGYGPGQGFDLPQGDYLLRAKMGEAVVETPFSIVTGELTAVNAVLGAGVLAISAPGMDFIEVFGAKKDIQGKRQSFGYGYGGEMQTTLPAGDYVVVARVPNGDATKEGSVTVTAGERSELTIQ